MTTFLAQNAMDSASIPLQTENNCRFYEADYSMSESPGAEQSFQGGSETGEHQHSHEPGSGGPCSGTLFVRMTKRERPGMGSQRSLNKVPHSRASTQQAG